LLLAALAACPLRSVGPTDRYRCLGASDCNPFGQVCCGDGFCSVACPADAGICEEPDASVGCPSGVSEGVGCSCEADGGEGSCLADQVCLLPEFFPGGVCSATCYQGLACPAGSQCLPSGLTDGNCFASCADDSDCGRAGYACAPGLALCVAACGSTGVDPGGRAGDGGACQPAFVPSLPDGGGLTWSPNVAISGSAGSLAEVGPTLASNGKGILAVGFTRVAPSGPGIGLTVSQDGGAFVVQPPLWDGLNELQSDPTLATDATGLFTYVWTGYDQSADNPAVLDTHIWSATSADAVHWTPVVEVDDWDGGAGLDKPWLAIDPATQAPWVVYRAIPAGVETLQLSIGAPGGQSFAPSVQLDDGLRPTLGRNSSQIVFDAAGNAYVAWIELGTANPNRDSDDFDGSSLNAVRFTRLLAGAGGAPGAPLAPNVLLSAAGDAVVQNQPGLAVAPDGSMLYAAYTRGTNEATDIVVTSSSDQGSTWSTPVKVNDDPTCATHLHPWTQLDAQGRLWLLWFDNRDDRGHVAWSVSTNGGLSFQPNGLASDAPFAFTTTRGAPGWVGDYLELFVSGSQLLAVWADPRPTDGTPPQYDDRSHVHFSEATLPP
jgi:hypothetical protein